MKKQEGKKQFLAKKEKKKKEKNQTNKNKQKNPTLIILKTDQKQEYKQIYIHIPRYL